MKRIGYGFLFSSALSLLLSCYYEADGKYDPHRCKQECVGGEICEEGKCVSQQDGSVGDAGTYCGDSIKNGSEQCDGTDLGGKNCASMGFAGGTLSCNSECKLTGCATAGFVHINTGTFSMGSPTSENCRELGSARETQHQVTLTRVFEISAYEVTQGEFQGLMGYNPEKFSSCGGDCPVEMVNWHEAVAYCNALSA